MFCEVISSVQQMPTMEKTGFSFLEFMCCVVFLKYCINYLKTSMCFVYSHFFSAHIFTDLPPFSPNSVSRFLWLFWSPLSPRWAMKVFLAMRLSILRQVSCLSLFNFFLSFLERTSGFSFREYQLLWSTRCHSYYQQGSPSTHTQTHTRARARAHTPPNSWLGKLD